MQITSPAFTHNQQMPAEYTCDGANVNPPLQFTDIPTDAQSLVLIMEDPDAQNWVHWTIANMDPKTTGIPQDSKPPSGQEGLTSFEKQGYGGACPPSGTHRYFFTLYALDIMLDPETIVDKTSIEEQMDRHIIAQAELIGLYTRN